MCKLSIFQNIVLISRLESILFQSYKRPLCFNIKAISGCQICCFCIVDYLQKKTLFHDSAVVSIQLCYAGDTSSMPREGGDEYCIKFMKDCVLKYRQ